MSSPQDAQINKFAIRSFRDTADKDYIHARLAHKAYLTAQFQWSALHALEKYCKCIILLNRVKGKKVGHEVKVGLEKIRDNTQLDIQVSEGTQDFLDRLENSARFRYAELSHLVVGMDLPCLDKAVWEIRRYCQILDQTSNMQLIENIDERTPENTRIDGGCLEKIIDNPKHPSRTALIWRNLYFSKLKREKISVTNKWGGENSPLSSCTKAMNQDEFENFLEEIKKYVYLPNEIKKAYIEQQYTNKARS